VVEEENKRANEATKADEKPSSIRKAYSNEIPGAETIWTFEGRGVPVELNWPKPGEMVFRLADPYAGLMGFEIIAFMKLALDTKTIAKIDSEEAKIKVSPTGRMQATVLASYSMTFGRSGKQVDTSTFSLRCRSEDETEWCEVIELPGEPRCLSISPEGTHIAFAIDECVTIVKTNGDTVGEIDGVNEVSFGDVWDSLYILRKNDGECNLSQYNLSTGKEHILLSDKGMADLAVSPAGGFIAFTREISDGQQVCILDEQARKLFSSQVTDLSRPSLTFSPDGKSLAFVSGRSIVKLNHEEVLEVMTDWK